MFMISITAKEFLGFSFSYCYLSRQNMIHNASSSKGDVAAADDDEENLVHHLSTPAETDDVNRATRIFIKKCYPK